MMECESLWHGLESTSAFCSRNGMTALNSDLDFRPFVLSAQDMRTNFLANVARIVIPNADSSQIILTQLPGNQCFSIRTHPFVDDAFPLNLQSSKNGDRNLIVATNKMWHNDSAPLKKIWILQNCVRVQGLNFALKFGFRSN